MHSEEGERLMNSFQALVSYWNTKLKLPVYEQGQVPDRAILPYCTVTLADSSNADRTTLTVFTWHSKDKNIERMEYADILHKAIPIQGERIEVDGGRLLISREGRIELYQDDGAIANRMGYEVRYYNI